ncbi:MAG TPA: mechanosensitive ion channel domain-containing protein [Methylococcaceae bacterium]|nr:mechanosensitive ion channel domain-containing protein [Methylococcaceae bacterium]
MTRLLAFFLVWLVLWAPGAFAVEPAADPLAAEMESAADHRRAPVTLDGKTLFQVRGVTAHTAEQRAAAIGARIKAIAADPSIAIDALQAVDAGDRTQIGAGDRLVMFVVDADAALEGISRPLLAEAILRKTSEAIAAYREDRSPRVLLAHAAYALGATLAAGLLLFAVLRLFRGLDVAAERRFKSRIEELEIGSHRIIHATQLSTALHGVIHALQVLSVLAIVYVYLNLALGLFPWTRPLGQRLLALVLDPLADMGAAILAAVPNLVFIAVLILVTRYVLKLTRLFFAGVDQGTIALRDFDRDWAWPTYKIARLLVIAFAVVVAYPYIPGSESEAFKGVSIFLGVIFSLGSSSVIANLIAGYTLTYRRAFKIGDRVGIGQHLGDVVEIRLMVTRLRSLKNEDLVIPNSMILGSDIVNYSTLAHTQGLILHTTVGIGYETPWRQVEAMLRLAAERTPGLLQTPPPFILQKALGDFCVTYELNVYCDNPRAMMQFYTLLHQNILDLFNEYGVQIMTPAYEGDPDRPKVVAKDQWFAAPASTASSSGGAGGLDRQGASPPSALAG